jgi:uncharacterized protein (DUF362 family)
MNPEIIPVRGYDFALLKSAIDGLIRQSAIDLRAKRHVVIKPNWIQESHQNDPAVWEDLITHPTLVGAVVDAIASHLAPGAVISVCDAPHTYANFDAILARGDARMLLQEISRRHAGITVEILDLRREAAVLRDGVIVSRRPLAQDPRGYAAVDLGPPSLFSSRTATGEFYGADYDREEVNHHHSGGRHEYLIAATPLCADLFVNLPKLKTHKKTGLTCALKNLVGINGDKNWLPHHTDGSPSQGGDERPDGRGLGMHETRLKRQMQAIAFGAPLVGPHLFKLARAVAAPVLGDSSRTIRNGNWYGNDTCWRMALDLNRALLYADPSGKLRTVSERKDYLAIVDGIVCGEGNGPLDPSPVSGGVLIAGTDPGEVDATAAKLMGFELDLLRIVTAAFEPHALPITTNGLSELRCEDGRVGTSISVHDVQPCVPGGFEPHFGWRQLNRARANDAVTAQ